MNQPSLNRSDSLLGWSAWISAVRNLWWLIVTAASFIAGLTVLIASSSLPQWARTAVVVIVTAAVTLPVGALLHRYVFRRKEAPLGYRWRSATYTFSFDKEDKRRQQQDLEIEIEAQRDNLPLFGNRYSWSGQGSKPEITLLSDAHVLLTDPRLVYDGWRYYYVHLGKPLLQGERAAIKIRQNFYDERGTFEPMLSKYVQEDVDSLTLKVIFSADMPPRDQLQAVERSSRMGEQRIIKRLRFEYDAATGCVSVTILNPQKRRTYALEWSWDYPGDSASVDKKGGDPSQ